MNEANAHLTEGLIYYICILVICILLIVLGIYIGRRPIELETEYQERYVNIDNTTENNSN